MCVEVDVKVLGLLLCDRGLDVVKFDVPAVVVATELGLENRDANRLVAPVVVVCDVCCAQSAM